MTAGVALVLAGFKTDPHLSEGPQTWHGWIRLLAFILLVLSLLLSLFFWWWRLRRDPRWRGYDVALLFASAWQWGFYLFLVVILTWIEVMALRLRSTNPSAPPRVR